MWHLLNFLRFGKRSAKKSKYAATPRPVDAGAASGLVIAGEPIPREPAKPARPLQSESRKTAKDAPRRLAQVVDAQRKGRWQAPELDGPEFGGLIERRGVDTRGLMPEKYEPKTDHENRKRAAAAESASRHGAVAETDDGQGLESTGMFLAALDNSAITLADSGLFRIGDDPEGEAAPESSFDPYDHKTSD